jgi:polysaccharide chain length determinant protein (PEP-CTERM system associated)
VDFREQLGVMTSKLLSRPNLEKVMKMADLDLKVHTPQQREALLNSLERSINLNAIQSERRGPSNLYEISTRQNDAELAKNVVQALLTIFLETAIGETRQDTGVARDFLDKQIKEYETKLSAAENRLMEFKRKNMGVLPNQGVGIFQRLQTARSDLSQLELELLEANNRRREIERQINSLDTTGQAVMPPGVAPQPTPLENRIANLQQRLDDLQLKYTSQHPDVREAKQTLQALEKQLKEQKASEGSQSNELSATNPVYQQLKIALSQVEAQIAGLKVRRDAYHQRLQKLEGYLKTLPEVEAELKRLDRDYEVNKQNYNELIARRESANLAKSMEATGEEVKFRVIDPPRVPKIPAGPNRPLFSTAVLLAALGAGLGLAYLLSQIRPVFYDRRGIQQVLELPVFGVISRTWTHDLLFKRRAQFAAYIVIGLVLIGVYGGVVYLNFKRINVTEYLT